MGQMGNLVTRETGTLGAENGGRNAGPMVIVVMPLLKRLLGTSPEAVARKILRTRYEAVERDMREVCRAFRRIPLSEVPREARDGKRSTTTVASLLTELKGCYYPPGQLLVGVNELQRWERVERVHAQDAVKYGELGNRIRNTARDIVYMMRGGPWLSIDEFGRLITAACQARNVCNGTVGWKSLGELGADELTGAVMGLRQKYDEMARLVAKHISEREPELYRDIVETLTREKRRELIGKAKRLYFRADSPEWRELQEGTHKLKREIHDELGRYGGLVQARIIGEVYGTKESGLSKETLIMLRFV